MKLLIIEDERSLLGNIVQYFNLETFSCDTAGSYEEGIWMLVTMSCFITPSYIPYKTIIVSTNIQRDPD
jgi:DNA-binding response OmpR family regulator